jgi:hypothetical protein
MMQIPFALRYLLSKRFGHWRQRLNQLEAKLIVAGFQRAAGRLGAAGCDALRFPSVPVAGLIAIPYIVAWFVPVRFIACHVIGSFQGVSVSVIPFCHIC